MRRLFPVVALALSMHIIEGPVCAQQSKTWTQDADFDMGSMVSVNHETVHDQLQLSRETTLLPFVNVAASKRGTIIRIDANTGKIIGEYHSAPQGALHNPSRTTVDRSGNVWASNRDQPHLLSSDMGAIVKIGVVLGGTRCNKDGSPNPGGAFLKPPFQYCTAVDRDGDGLIRTSRGLNDIHPWQGEDATAATDECILLYLRVPARNCRHLSIDEENNVWSGGYSMNSRDSATLMKLNGQTGAVMNLHKDLSCGGYGGLVSRKGLIFSSSMDGGGGPLLMLSPAGAATCISEVFSYGLAEDPDGHIWATTFSDARLFKLSEDGVVLPGFPVDGLGKQPRGLAVTPSDGHVWIACSGSHELERRDANGILVKRFSFDQHSQPGLMPTGVAVDINENIWVTNAQSDNVFRINPKGGADRKGSIDLVVDLGTGAFPYNYSDMTGSAFGENIPLYGSWTVVHHGGKNDIVWQRIHWNASTDGDSRIEVSVRAANTAVELSDASYRVVPNGGLLCDTLVKGRYLQILVEFFRGSNLEQNPVLYDLTVDGSDVPIIQAERVTICEGDSLRLMADPRYTDILWDNGSHFPTRYVHDGGMYWYSAMSPFGCRLLSDTIRVTTRPTPYPVVEASATRMCAEGEVFLTAPSGYAAYHWFPVSGPDTGRTLRVTGPGTYSVAVVDSFGCVGISAPVQVTLFPRTEITLRSENDSVLCRDGSAVLRATAGFARYRWSTGDVTLTGELPVDSPGVYRVAVTDSNGCEAVSNPVHITFATRPEFDVVTVGPAQRCHGDSVEIRATPGFQHYRWSNGREGMESRIVARESGAFWVIVTDDHGCEWLSDTLQIDFFPKVEIALAVAGDSVVCHGGTGRLQATEGYERYIWSTGTETNTPVLDVDRAGTFFVTAVDRNGCSGRSNPVRIRMRPPVEVDIVMEGGTVLCAGASGAIFATPGFPRYRWSTGQDGASNGISVADSGKYWVEVLDGFGCSGRSDTIHVTIDDELRPVISLESDTLCPGETLLLDAGPGYASYTWSTGDTTRSIVVDRAGRYALHVTNSHACEGDTAVEIFVESPPAVSLSADTLCPGETATLDAGSGYTAYQWSTGAQSRTITVHASGPYTVDVTTARGCVLSDTVTLHTWPRPDITIDGPATVCANTSASYGLSGLEIENIRWTLTGGGDIQAGGETDRVTILWEDGGMHVVSITVTDAQSTCTYDTSFTVFVEDIPPPVIEGQPAFCEGDSTLLSVRSPAGHCTWHTPVGLDTGRTISIRNEGQYIIEVRSDAGCIVRDTLLVIEHPRPRPVITGDTLLAAGDSTELHLDAVYSSVVWHLPDGSSTNRTSITVRDTGMYRVVVHSAFGCRGETGHRIRGIGGVVSASCVVGLPKLEAEPGDTIHIPLSLLVSTNLEHAGAEEWTARLHVEKGMLLPVGGTPVGWTEGSQRVIPVDGMHVHGGDELAVLEFLVMLGSTDMTPLHIARFMWLDATVDVRTVDGELRLRICREGGDRLFDGSGVLRLEQNSPNPFNTRTIIECELIEYGPTELIVTDMLGRRVRNLLHGMQQPGIYRLAFDGSAFPSGSYFCILRTPSALLLRRMQLLK
ncbi:MAG: hypothetical protein JXA28_04230 [Bacteroidetes bacterium]|nr:hypothetical protein [Bacteroidota bacterium]